MDEVITFRRIADRRTRSNHNTHKYFINSLPTHVILIQVLFREASLMVGLSVETREFHICRLRLAQRGVRLNCRLHS